MLLEIQIMSSLVFAFAWLVGVYVTGNIEITTEGRNIKKKKMQI